VNPEGIIMASTFTLLEAIAVATALLFVFAIYRRSTRAPKPPAFLDNNIVAFGSSMLITIALMGSLAFEAVSVMPFVHSAFWAAMLAIACHIAIWSVARSIIPIRTDEAASGTAAR
jgi:membrane-associated HD superfamily phosphohydrolase